MADKVQYRSMPKANKEHVSKVLEHEYKRSSDTMEGSWGKGGFSSGIAKSAGNNKDPAGQHGASCIAGSDGWCSSRWGRPFYDEGCPGCRHARAGGSFASGGQESGVFKVLSVVGGYKQAKMSLWD
ncbi:hypothetical protein MAR_027437 [Mya arenaria]|uniref:Uncharacterized protein n=1 Tax=Mya arenaria TaxID=6604 RepID=A0ABY7EWH8_MYAAR|nr:hypothetical protein MAR_027437 [Mya arenaria]